VTKEPGQLWTVDRWLVQKPTNQRPCHWQCSVSDAGSRLVASTAASVTMAFRLSRWSGPWSMFSPQGAPKYTPTFNKLTGFGPPFFSKRAQYFFFDRLFLSISILEGPCQGGGRGHSAPLTLRTPPGLSECPWSWLGQSVSTYLNHEPICITSVSSTGLRAPRAEMTEFVNQGLFVNYTLYYMLKIQMMDREFSSILQSNYLGTYKPFRIYLKCWRWYFVTETSLSNLIAI